MYTFTNTIPKSYKGLYAKLLEDFKDYLSGNLNLNINRSVKSYQDSLKCFLFNEHISSGDIGITLSEQHYSRGAIVNGKESKLKISYIFTKRLFTFLEDSGYILLTKGGLDEITYVYNHGYESDPTKDKFTKEVSFKSGFISLQDKWYSLKDTLVTGDEILPVRNVLLFKSSDKVIVNRNLNRYLKEKRDYLQELNTFNAGNKVTVDSTRYSLQSYKVYNNSSYKVNGKTYTYCGYQNLPKTEREKTMINGQPTICLDYSCFEASVMYSLAQKEIPSEDLYYIGMEGFSPLVERKLLKVVFLIMLNTKSRLSANSGVSNWIKKNFNTEKSFKSGDIPTPVLSSKELIARILDKHSPIKDLFFNYGSKDYNIPNITSEINDYVTNVMLNNKIVVAQIHDGFIVERQHKDLLHDTMFRAYEKVLGSDINCRIKQEF